MKGALRVVANALNRGDAWAREALRGTLPHLDWDASRRLEAGSDYWRVEPQLPCLEGTRLVYAYRLVPLGAGGIVRHDKRKCGNEKDNAEQQHGWSKHFDLLLNDARNAKLMISIAL